MGEFPCWNLVLKGLTRHKVFIKTGTLSPKLDVFSDFAHSDHSDRKFAETRRSRRSTFSSQIDLAGIRV
jgi:hypothetical protein